jgi:hypothetical protein
MFFLLWKLWSAYKQLLKTSVSQHTANLHRHRIFDSEAALFNPTNTNTITINTPVFKQPFVGSKINNKITVNKRNKASLSVSN